MNEPLVVTLIGKVHVTSCAQINGMTWAWEGRNNLQGDFACSSCLPHGLPEHTHHEFTELEVAHFRAILEETDQA